LCCSPGGIPARNTKGERLLLYIGIIDILQNYRFQKRMEHAIKSMVHDGVSGEGGGASRTHSKTFHAITAAIFPPERCCDTARFAWCVSGHYLRASAWLLRDPIPDLLQRQSV
jgi:hypothetical protein